MIPALFLRSTPYKNGASANPINNTLAKLLIRDIVKFFKSLAEPFGFKKLEYADTNYLSSRKKVVFELMA